MKDTRNVDLLFSAAFLQITIFYIKIFSLKLRHSNMQTNLRISLLNFVIDQSCKAIHYFRSNNRRHLQLLPCDPLARKQ